MNNFVNWKARNMVITPLFLIFIIAAIICFLVLDSYRDGLMFYFIAFLLYEFDKNFEKQCKLYDEHKAQFLRLNHYIDRYLIADSPIDKKYFKASAWDYIHVIKHSKSIYRKYLPICIKRLGLSQNLSSSKLTT